MVASKHLRCQNTIAQSAALHTGDNQPQAEKHYAVKYAADLDGISG